MSFVKQVLVGAHKQLLFNLVANFPVYLFYHDKT